MGYEPTADADLYGHVLDWDCGVTPRLRVSLPTAGTAGRGGRLLRC